MRGKGLRACCGNSNSNSVIPILPAGHFRQRVVIQEPDLTPDPIGGYSGGQWMEAAGWDDVATVWAYIQTVNPKDFRDHKQFRDKQYLEQQWYLVTIRYRGGIGTNMRLSWNGLYFSIFDVVNTDVVNWEIQMFCREGG